MVRGERQRERARVVAHPRAGRPDDVLGRDVHVVDVHAPGDGRAHAHDVPVVDQGHLRGVARQQHRDRALGVRLGAGQRDPQQQPVGRRGQRGEELLARQAPAVAVGDELGAVHAGLVAGRRRLAADRGEQLAARHDLLEEALVLGGRAVSREEAERVRVHLQQLRGAVVDPGERLDQLVVRREGALAPEPVTAERLGRGQGDETEAAEVGEVLGRKAGRVVGRAGALAKGGREVRDRLEARRPGCARMRSSSGSSWRSRDPSSPNASRRTSSSRERPATSPGGGVVSICSGRATSGSRKRSTLPATTSSQPRGVRLALGLDRARAHARPVARDDLEVGQPPRREGVRQLRVDLDADALGDLGDERVVEAAEHLLDAEATVARAPSRPARRGCTASPRCCVGRRRESRSAAAKVRTTTDSMRAGIGSQPQRGVDARLRPAAARVVLQVQLEHLPALAELEVAGRRA